MRPLSIVAIAVAPLIGGCARETPQWEVYAEIVADPSPDPERDIPRCLQLTDPDFAGDCALTVALRGAQSASQAPDTWCDAIPADPWGFECRFQAAEVLRSNGETDRAVALCRQAGRFARDCALHLWQKAVHTLARSTEPADLVTVIPSARRMHARWLARVGQYSDFDSLFWRKFFRVVFNSKTRVDVAHCDPLPDDLMKRCQNAVVVILDQALRTAAGKARWRAAFCDSPSPTLATLVTLPDAFDRLTTIAPHPHLDAFIAEFHTPVCTQSRMPPWPDPPPSLDDPTQAFESPEISGKRSAPPP